MTFPSSPPRMKMAGVATMNSYSEFIVGFSYVVKSPRQAKSGLSWLPKLGFSRKRLLGLFKSPDHWRSQLKAVARRIPKVDRLPTFRPVDLCFYGHSVPLQVLSPKGYLRCRYSESQMPFSASAVHRNPYPIHIAGFRPGLAWIEEQKDTLPAAEKHMPFSLATNSIQPQDIGV